MDLAGWQGRLDELARAHQVPGASLAVLADGAVTALATGVLHTGTGVTATTDSIFQLGSIAKAYTATALLRLADQGAVDLDAPVADVLPSFKVADPEVSRLVTARHLLTHSSGIDGDLFLDTGRGDDCLDRYVRACAGLAQNQPLGASFSYCNSGYIILGRIIEAVTGQVWDAALAKLVVEPLGLAHTWTLPEDVLRFRAAMGHVSRTAGEDPEPASSWYEMRSLGPAGLVCATAADVIAFARLHLDGGLAADGTRLLASATIAEAQRSQVAVPNPFPMASHWGLGWALQDWAGRRVYGHDGDTIGQAAYLRVVPDAGVAVALLTNSDRSRALYKDVFGELLGELCDLSIPAPLQPPPVPPAVDLTAFVGVYERTGMRLEITLADGELSLRGTPTGGLAALVPPSEMALTPLSDSMLLGRPAGSPRWTPLLFSALPDGSAYVHDGARATPKTR